MSDQKKTLYLDYAAAAPLWPNVVDLVTETLRLSGNPGSLHLFGHTLNERWHNAINQLARLLGCQPDEIIITSGATESSNLALLGTIRHLVDTKPIEIVTTAAEHPATSGPIKALEQLGAEIVYLPTTNQGHVLLANLKQSITLNTRLVSIIAAHNETGAIQSMHRIIEVIRAAEKRISHKILIHLDASQWAAWHKINPHHLDVDLVTISGAKIGGLAGLLYAKRGTDLRPILFGGGQQRTLRPGTEVVAGALGLAKALSTTWDQLPQTSKQVAELKNLIGDTLMATFPQAVRRDSIDGLPNIIHLTIPGLDAASAVYALSEAGIAISTGSACSSNEPEEKQRILNALGVPKADRDATLRISLGWTTKKSEIIRALPIMIDILNTILKQSPDIKKLEQAGKRIADRYNNQQA